MKISFIGSGNVATHLATALNKISGVNIQQIISKDKSHAKNLAMQVRADHSDELSRLKTNFDILIFAVGDDALLNILNELDIPDNRILVHTAGSVPSTVFEKVSRKYGVIYPLQTFSKNKSIDWKDLPIFLTASDESTEKRLSHITKQLSRNNHIISDEQRFALHVSAVFACNFSNAAMTISQQICEERNLDFSLLHPLIRETFDKALRNGPKFSQTGPAKRGDTTVMNKHMQFLSEMPLEKKIYEMVSDFISQRYENDRS
ncbi:MAG: DUF2520 domain-containing protein [Saprospiraceae bacterium]|nr:DUF2520 domain-containing protein [Saprospiraceae bacterium]